MPELPEVQTTVEGLRKKIIGKTIMDVWSDFHVGAKYRGRQDIKNKKYYDNFRKTVRGAKIEKIERLGKNILINLNNKFTIVVHMKMTGHLMVGKYEKIVKGKEHWIPAERGPLEDSFNRFVHFVATLSDGRHLVLSDMRKFASINLEKTDNTRGHKRLSVLGPDPFEISFGDFSCRIAGKGNAPIKKVLMDQSVLSGIGNIYSDEILWASGVHPLSLSKKIPPKSVLSIFINTKKILEKSIKLGGDSMSDYRNVSGNKGSFQNFHKAYKQTGKKCQKRGCGGIIERTTVGARSSHFCPRHQKIYK